MKITGTKKLFVFLLFFSSTISPLRIEEVKEDDSNPKNNPIISKKSSEIPLKSDSRSISKKMIKNFLKTETGSPEWRTLNAPQTTYFFYHNTQINWLNPPPDLFRLIFSDIAETSMPPLYYNDDVPSVVPVKKNPSNTTKLSLIKKVLTDQQNKHSGTQSVRNRLKMMNQLLIKFWGPPLL